MKIDNLKTPGLTGPGRAVAKTVAKPESGSEGSQSGAVKISSVSSSLSAQNPEVNAARVQEIRQAISEGRFEINASAVADRLISAARELVGSRRQA